MSKSSQYYLATIEVSGDFVNKDPEESNYNKEPQNTFVERVTNSKDIEFLSAYTDNYNVESVEWKELSEAEHESLKHSGDYWFVEPVPGTKFSEVFEREIDLEYLLECQEI